MKRQPGAASDKVPAKEMKTAEYQQTQKDVQCACQEAANGTGDQTSGSTYFNNRWSDSTEPRTIGGTSYDITYQDGPFVDSHGKDVRETYSKPALGELKKDASRQTRSPGDDQN